jgi:drug/metabolite transporter (DMT)-like permease
MNFRHRFVQYATLVLLALIWGSSFILMKRGLVYFDSTEVAAYRMSIAMIVLLPIALRNLSVLRDNAWPLFFVGLFGNTVPAFLFALAQTQIPSSLSGMLNSLTTLFTLVLGVLFFRMSPLRSQVWGVLVALVGTFGLIGFAHLLDLTTGARYSLLVVAASACYGLAVNIIKSHLRAIPPSHITSLSFILTVPALLIYLIFFTDFVSQVGTQPESRWGVFYISLLGILSTALAVILFNRLIKDTTALFASSVTYLIPVVAIGWGVLDGEVVAAHQFGYLALILCGIFLINMPRSLFSSGPRR